MRINVVLKNSVLSYTLAVLGILFAAGVSHADDPLPSWRDKGIKNAIIDYVEDITKEGSQNFVPQSERVASIDLDGTLLCEHPVNYQRSLAIKRLKDHVNADPSLKNVQPYKSAWEDDGSYYNLKENHGFVFLSAFKDHDQSFYHNYVRDFLRNDHAPHWKRPFQSLFYQPGIELVRYLESKGFDVYICSTSEEECIRLLINEVLGLKHSQVIGNEVSIKLRDNHENLDFVMAGQFKAPANSCEGKCMYISQHIGKKPIFAFGNSMGDYNMLKYASTSPYRNFVMILDHDDSDREILYHDEGLLKMAKNHGWHIASMKKDFQRVFSGDDQGVPSQISLHMVHH